MKTAQDTISEIKTKVEAAGFTMADLCRVVQISHSQLSRWQSGQTEPLFNAISRLDHAANAMVSARLQVLNKAMDEAVK